MALGGAISSPSGLGSLKLYTHYMCMCVPTLTDFTYRCAYILSKHKIMILCGVFWLGIVLIPGWHP